MCIGTPDIAQMLTRYPVSPKEEMRSVDLHGVLVWSPPPHTVESMRHVVPKVPVMERFLYNIMSSQSNIYPTHPCILGNRSGL